MLASRLTATFTLARIAALLLLAGAPAVSAASPQCGPVDQVLTLLAEKYGEQMIGEGQGPNGVRLLLFVHPEGDTWTTVVVIPDGTACLVASGADWTLHEFTPAGLEI